MSDFDRIWRAALYPPWNGVRSDPATDMLQYTREAQQRMEKRNYMSLKIFSNVLIHFSSHIMRYTFSIVNSAISSSQQKQLLEKWLRDVSILSKKNRGKNRSFYTRYEYILILKICQISCVQPRSHLFFTPSHPLKCSSSIVQRLIGGDQLRWLLYFFTANSSAAPLRPAGYAFMTPKQWSNALLTKTIGSSHLGPLSVYFQIWSEYDAGYAIERLLTAQDEFMKFMNYRMLK